MSATTRKPPRRSALERLEARTDRTGDCWLWTGRLNEYGYGTLRVDGRLQMAHRVAYQGLIGPIPDGKQIDHLCRVRHCVNPDHMEPVTSRENTLRGVGLAGINAAKTHCKRGHAFDEANTYRWRSSRRCKTCRREAKRRKRDLPETEGAR